MTHADRQRAYRERKRNAGSVTPDVTADVTAVPSVTPRNADTVTALRARVTELEDEVARLKRDLATAHGKVAALERERVYPVNVRETLDVVGPALAGIGKATRPVSSGLLKRAGAGGYHGVLCNCQGCQRERGA